MKKTLILTILAAAAAPAFADGAATAVLPPLEPWEGESLSLVAAADDPWITPAEAGGFETTPSYDETVAWLRRLVDAAPELHMEPFGKSGEGRDLYLVVASSDHAFTPEAVQKTGKAVVLAQAGIHSGEIDGKDAGLMLLRDMTVAGKKKDLLQRAVFLFVPIFNVDGHERSSPYGRMNQRGPRETGWRTNATNLNFNRDYTKADTPGMQAMLRLLNTWPVDLYVDLHVTDGHDFQYDVTWSRGTLHTYSPAQGRWQREHLNEAIERDMKDMGHVPGPFFFAMGPTFDRGILDWTGGPRFSDGYGAARHLLTILVENHSLKPYRRRVLGTYVFLESLLRHTGAGVAGLREAAATDRARRPGVVPLAFGPGEEFPEKMELLAIEHRRERSEVSGREEVVWTGKPVTLHLPKRRFDTVTASVKPSRAYWIPAAWSEVIERLALHGVELKRQAAAREVEVDMYRFAEPKFAEQPFEGRIRVEAKTSVERRRERYPAGSVRVPTDQPLGVLAVLLLEPSSPDSFFQWGFFHSVLQRTEYGEAYAVEPMARRMLAEDEALRAEFEKKLAEDEEFAADPRARLDFFYRRSPYYDDRYLLYPVGREP